MFGFTGTEGAAGTYFGYESGNGNNFTLHTYGGDVTDSPIVNDQWVYLTATYDPNQAGGAINVYYNGALKATQVVQNGVLGTLNNFGIELPDRGGWTEDVTTWPFTTALERCGIAQMYTSQVNNILPVTTNVVLRQHCGHFGPQRHRPDGGSLSDNGTFKNGVVTNGGATPSTLILTPAASTTFSGSIQDGTQATSLVVNGPGTQVLAGNSTYTGGTTIQQGTLQLGDGVARNGSILGGVFNNGAWSSPTPCAGFPGQITGVGSLTMNGPGTLTLNNNSNTFTGSLTVAGGVLEVTKLNDGSGGNGANGTGAITVGGNVGVPTLRFIGTNDFTTRAINLVGANAGLDSSDSGEGMVFGGPISIGTARGRT